MDGREDSRSYSEEEAAIRLSKSSRRERERRTRSESARYDRCTSGAASEAEVRERSERSRRKKKSLRYRRHEYGESSIDQSRSDEAEAEEGSKEKLNGKDVEEEILDRRNSLSDDSLEVVVVLDESVEKKSEKIVSRRRSKVSGGVEKEGKVETSRAKSDRERKLRAGDHGTTVCSEESKKRKKAMEPPIASSKRRNSEDEEGPEGMSPAEEKSPPYRNDATDSTSRETVERVTVTAMVHNDQAPDTPELTPKDAKLPPPRSARPESSRGPRRDTTSVKSEMDHILEKADELQSALIRKASDLRRERRQEETSSESVIAAEGEKIEGAGSHESYEATSGSKTEKEENDEKRQGTDADSNETVNDHGHGRVPKPSHGEHSTKEDPKMNSTGTEPMPRTAVKEASVSDAEKKSKQRGALESKPELRVDKAKYPKSRRDASSASGRSAGKSVGSTTTKKKKKKKEKRGANDESAKKQIVDGIALASPASPVQLTSRGPNESIDERSKEDSLREEESLPGERSSTEITKTAEGRREMDKKSEHKKHEPAKEEDEDDGNLRVSEAPAVSRSDSFRFIDDSSLERKSSGSPRSARPSTAKSEKSSPPKSSLESRRRKGERERRRRSSGDSSGSSSSSGSSTDDSTSSNLHVESSGERSPDRGAIVAVIESPEWVAEDEDDEAIDKEIREAIGQDAEREEDTERDGDDDGVGVTRVLPSTSEDDETPRTGAGPSRTPVIDSLPQVHTRRR